VTGDITVIANGRASWVGWLELKTVAVNEVATADTARVIQDLKADILTVLEAESRATLQMFSNAMFPAVGYRAYEQVMLVEGNDTGGIDVGFLAREEVTLLEKMPTGVGTAGETPLLWLMRRGVARVSGRRLRPDT
jgi:hypothetical protein